MLTWRAYSRWLLAPVCFCYITSAPEYGSTTSPALSFIVQVVLLLSCKWILVNVILTKYWEEWKNNPNCFLIQKPAIVCFAPLLNTSHEPISSQAQEDEERDKIDLIRLALARNLSRTILWGWCFKEGRTHKKMTSEQKTLRFRGAIAKWKQRPGFLPLLVKSVHSACEETPAKLSGLSRNRRHFHQKESFSNPCW